MSCENCAHKDAELERLKGDRDNWQTSSLALSNELKARDAVLAQCEGALEGARSTASMGTLKAIIRALSAIAGLKEKG